MPKEEGWHRNVRHSRETAKGILAAVKLGLEIPQAIIEAAKRVLVEHHATDADTMQAWRMEQRMQVMEQMLNGNYQIMPRLARGLQQLLVPLRGTEPGPQIEMVA